MSIPVVSDFPTLLFPILTQISVYVFWILTLEMVYTDYRDINEYIHMYMLHRWTYIWVAITSSDACT